MIFKQKRSLNEFAKFLANMILMHTHLMIGYRKDEQSDQLKGDFMSIMITNRKMNMTRSTSNILI